MNRREALKVFGGGALALGAGKALDNVVLGYERNLRSQDLASAAAERMAPSERYDRAVGEYRVLHQQGTLFVVEGERAVDALSLAEGTRERASRLDEEYGLDGTLTALFADVRALRDGRVRFEFSTFEPFFERVVSGEQRPYAADVLRGSRTADPELVGEFTGADPANPKATLQALVGAFRDHADYDVPRYVAGSLTDNVFAGTVRLRKHFEEPVDFESIADSSGTGMFCYEFTYRSMEALHALPAFEQDVPVVTAKVNDYRHKHVYTAVASVLREDGDLVVPMTFVDYTHTTLYDDFELTGLMGEGFEAYNDRHRADDIFWDA